MSAQRMTNIATALDGRECRGARLCAFFSPPFLKGEDRGICSQVESWLGCVLHVSAHSDSFSGGGHCTHARTKIHTIPSQKNGS